MWGTTASCDELTGDFGGTFEATSIGDRSLFRPFAENQSLGILGLLQQNLPTTDMLNYLITSSARP